VELPLRSFKVLAIERVADGLMLKVVRFAGVFLGVVSEILVMRVLMVISSS
jgi:hypothetical protein